jgi:NhaP-type Na+/H+ or K+/H+ antiporter
VTFIIWAIVIGVLLTTMALSGSLLKRLPLSTSMFYLAAGCAIGPSGWGLLRLDPLAHGELLERTAEIALLISLFAAGLKLGLPIANRRWYLAVRLALPAMLVTIGLIAAIGVIGLHLPLGAAVLLAAIIAPTDPVLASDVQVEDAADRDRLRFCLTGESGLNDGIAFPFVMLGLGLLGAYELGAFAWRWLARDFLWAMAAGIGVGAGLGIVIGKLVLHLRTQQKEALGLDEFLVLGLIALAYGIALLLHASGFLAVFAAGLALRRSGRWHGRAQMNQDVDEELPALDTNIIPDKAAQEQLASDPQHAGAYMMGAVSGFNEQLERIGEVAVVLIVGAMLPLYRFSVGVLAFALLLFFVVRPLSVWIGLLRAPLAADQRVLISWFGIRGIGSIYYVLYAIHHGLPARFADQLMTLTIGTVAASIVLHGISVTPLMRLYGRRRASSVERVRPGGWRALI